MDSILLIGLLILAFVGIPIGIGLLFYFIPKRLGYPRIAKYLTIAYGLVLSVFTFFAVFEDQLFTENNAKELVEEQEFQLFEEFELVHNESMSAIGEYYHTFTLEISEQDKQDAILKIIDAENFRPSNSSIEQMIYQRAGKYFGPKVIQNYETENAYIREYFEPSGREGYAPTFRRISIRKLKNELIFEDIDE